VIVQRDEDGGVITEFANTGLGALIAGEGVESERAERLVFAYAPNRPSQVATSDSPRVLATALGRSQGQAPASAFHYLYG
jgi:hypothetical protein